MSSANPAQQAAEAALAQANKELAWEVSKAAVDAAGIVDPTPISDLLGAGMSAADGDFFGVGCSLLSMVPYVGDAVGKTAKAARAAKKINDLRKKVAAAAAKLNKVKAAAKKAPDPKAVVAQSKKLPAGKPQPCATCPLKAAPAKLGKAATNDYKGTYFKAFPELEGEVVVHHAIEQQVLKRYPGLLTEAELHSLENLRGIPKSINNDVHLSQIRKSWNQFYKAHPKPTKQQLLDHATKVDNLLGHLFKPPVR